MRISNLLKPNAVRTFGSASSKKRVLQELGQIAANVYGLDAQKVAEALNEREALGPTGVGHGVALPHARLSGLADVSAIFLLLEKPVSFDSVDRQPVDLVVALLAPPEAGVEHLKALAMVSRTLRDKNTRAKLRANADPATLYTILTATETEQTA